MEEVFCKDCYHYEPDKTDYTNKGYQPLEEHCWHPDNLSGHKTYAEFVVEFINTPKEINSDNRCQNFEHKSLIKRLIKRLKDNIWKR